MDSAIEGDRPARQPSMIPSVVIALFITAAVLALIQTYITLSIATAVCEPACPVTDRYALVDAHTFLTWGLFIAAAVGALLARNKRWWFAFPLGVIVADVAVGSILATTVS